MIQLGLWPFLLGRHSRNLRARITYPLWIAAGKAAPDNHAYKTKRILRVAREYSCETFVETGTFYGQTVAAMSSHFRKVFSCELSARLWDLNRRSFAAKSNVNILLGDSATVLNEVIREISGRTLFWLDGHYSGPGTALGDQVSPVLGELAAIRKHHRNDHCILVDDARLFTGSNGYPTLASLRLGLRKINAAYEISVNGDCIIALP